MLQSLMIRNYVLINDLEVQFFEGLNTITGETGSGKSVLLGALGLLLGSRAESGLLKDPQSKCVVEGRFLVHNPSLKSFFEEREIDFEESTLLRREILPNGKSRAFINDSPVNSSVLRELGEKLVDIHSQHQNLLAGNLAFQLQVVDHVALNQEAARDFQEGFSAYQTIKDRLARAIRGGQKALAESDFLRFQLDQLEQARLSDPEELQSLEEELQVLEHAREIKELLAGADVIFHEDNTGLFPQIRQLRTKLQQLAHVWPSGAETAERIDSVLIELKDMASDLASLQDKVQVDPGRMQEVTERLDQLNQLCRKHQVQDVAGLLEIRADFQRKLAEIENFDVEIAQLEAERARQWQFLEERASGLSGSRHGVVGFIEGRVTAELQKLGMPEANFAVRIGRADEMTETGWDAVEFLFSANPGMPMQEIGKAASGGELSRLMLCLKSLIHQSGFFSTVVFDEIDTGVSGAIADQVGEMIFQMARDVQVLNISHLPQIAAKGLHHFKVFKQSRSGITESFIRPLEPSERLEEIATLISGKNVTGAALEQASNLLSNQAG